MAKTRWYAFSGLLSRVLSNTTEVVSTIYEVVEIYFFSEVETWEFETLQEAQDFVKEYPDNGQLPGSTLEIRERAVTETFPAVQKGVAFVPLVPFPVFTRPGKVLTTRGFWDVASTTNPAGSVSNFAFGMTFLPTKVVYKVGMSPNPAEPNVKVFQIRDNIDIPDPLLDDVGWFTYDSFVRVTTDVNQDPPFHSKTNKRFPANSVLAVVAAVEVQVDNLQSLRLDFGIRFRVLIEQ